MKRIVAKRSSSTVQPAPKQEAVKPSPPTSTPQLRPRLPIPGEVKVAVKKAEEAAKKVGELTKRLNDQEARNRGYQQLKTLAKKQNISMGEDTDRTVRVIEHRLKEFARKHNGQLVYTDRGIELVKASDPTKPLIIDRKKPDLGETIKGLFPSEPPTKKSQGNQPKEPQLEPAYSTPWGEQIQTIIEKFK